jgi:hypothetical protein
MKNALILLAMLLIVLSSSAQHEHHMMKDTTKPKEMHDMEHMDMNMPMDHSMYTMPSHSFSRNLAMNRNGSGTSWLPDATPMYMLMKQDKNTDWMFHGSVFLRYTNTDIFNKGNRGSNKVDAPNWFMAMMNRKIGKRGLLNATAMISFDRLTEGGQGYPLLLQSGETYNGKLLVDKQHPHDFFSGLTLGYTQMINKDVDVFAYIGYPGEPALGPPAFMHRISSMNNPDAPLGHHWQDASHITFGVATLGFRYKNFKIEGSAFNGREPDEERYGFDKLRLNSYSYRFSYNATQNWAFQFSQGFIHEPEIKEPGVNVTRTTASALYSKRISSSQQYDAAVIWGYNDKGDGHKEHSILFEDNHRFGMNTLYSRYEFVQKSTEELDLEDDLGDHTFPVHAVSLGYNRTLFENRNGALAIGTQFKLNFIPAGLRDLYGRLPVGGQVYLQLRPALHKH